jgi:hypothetical protein
MLTGKKTYMTAVGGILTAVGAYFSGEMEMGTMISVVTTSLLAVFLRSGSKSDAAGSSEATAVTVASSEKPAS